MTSQPADAPSSNGTSWWQRPEYDASRRPPFPTEFAVASTSGDGPAGAAFRTDARIVCKRGGENLQPSYTFAGVDYPSLVALTQGLLDKWESSYPVVDPGADTALLATATDGEGRRLLQQLWDDVDPSDATVSAGPGGSAGGPSGDMPKALAEDFSLDALGASIIARDAEPESLARAAPAAHFPLARGGLPAVPANVALLHAVTAAQRAAGAVIWSAVVDVEGRPHYVKRASNRRKTKLALLRTGVSGPALRLLWAWLTSALAPDKEPEGLAACARLARELLTRNWAGLALGSLERSVVWAQAQMGSQPDFPRPLLSTFLTLTHPAHGEDHRALAGEWGAALHARWRHGALVSFAGYVGWGPKPSPPH